MYSQTPRKKRTNKATFIVVVVWGLCMEEDVAKGINDGIVKIVTDSLYLKEAPEIVMQVKQFVMCEESDGE